MLKEGIFLGKRYEILDRIGSGGMADVYKGKDHKLNRYVAIKVLKSDFRSDETFIKKFLSEAQAAAGLMHPNVVNVYDVAAAHRLDAHRSADPSGKILPHHPAGRAAQNCSAPLWMAERSHPRQPR